MRRLESRHITALTTVLAASTLILVGCSSEPEPAASTVAPLPSASALSSETSSDEATASESAAPVGAAAAACAAYFDLDLLNSAYAGGAVKDGDLTEEQVRADFEDQLKVMRAQARAAVADGSGDPKLLANAKRMRKIVNSLGEGEALSDLSKAQQTRFAKASLRVQKACDRAGLPLPADNVTARTAAGL
jgi:hypothetical protein